MIGGLMYLTASRPDIAFATFVCAHYQACPTVKHLKEVKRIFWYLRQSYNMGLWYSKDSGFELNAYSDTDQAGCKDDCKSTLGGIQFLIEKLVSWSLKKQDYTAMSTAEAKYVSLSACCTQVIGMRTQLLDYAYTYNKIPIYCDSKSAIAISCNPVQHLRTKHINIRYHFIKEHIEKGTMELYFVGAEYQLADLFTKALPKKCFDYLVHRIVIIMAQPQRPVDVHQDELCPPNKRYDLMNANKKVDLKNLLWQFWHTLQEDGSKNKLKFMLDIKELTLTLDDFRTIFHLPQATDNNHDHFVHAPKFSKMVPFYINNLGFTLELRSTSNFKTTGLLQLWQTLCKMFSRISQRVRDRYYNLEDDVMIKSIFNSGKSKGVVGMKILDWMITDKMKLTENYRLYAEVFGVDVPTTQSLMIESTQGTDRTTRAPRTPNPEIAEVLQDTLQVSPTEQKSREELEATQNVEKVKEHLMAEEIEKLVEETKNVEENVKLASSPLRNDDNQTNPDTRLEPRSDKERPEGEREGDRGVSETTRILRTHSTLITLDSEKLQDLTETDIIPSSSTPSSSSSKLSATNRLLSLFKSKPGCFKRYKSFFDELQGKYDCLFCYLTTKFMPRRKFNALAQNLQDIMLESLPKMVDERIKKIPQTQVPLYVAQGQKTYEHGTFVFGKSSSGQDYESEPGPSTSDDVLSNEKVSQELMDEMSQTVNEAKLRKIVDEM
uniref:Ribonuclease H-like domain-containing protein n=1 Tax=Tanacetum cinerariifolium TaxID=118510 RepID=A0A6L2K006_TANCI|nr:ribonuclease H-like domain-containing protein [Tanacetum cinerariifolium]